MTPTTIELACVFLSGLLLGALYTFAQRWCWWRDWKKRRARLPGHAQARERVLVLTRFNLHQGRIGHRYDHIIVRCPITDEQRLELLTRLAPGGLWEQEL